jgi:hypothetical protein
MNISLGACRTLNDLDRRVTVGVSSKSMIDYRMLPRYEVIEKSGVKVKNCNEPQTTSIYNDYMYVLPRFAL